MEVVTMGKFKVLKTAKGHVFHLLAGNGEIIGTSESYSSKESCKSGIESVRKNAPIAKTEDQTEKETVTNPKFEIYQDRKKQFRFRLKASNGKEILASEGYTEKKQCKQGIASVKKNAPGAKVVDEE